MTTSSSSSAAMNYEHQFLCRLANAPLQLQCLPPSLSYSLLVLLLPLLLLLLLLLLLPYSTCSSRFLTTFSYYSFIASSCFLFLLPPSVPPLRTSPLTSLPPSAASSLYFCLLQLPFLLPPLAPPSLTSPSVASFCCLYHCVSICFGYQFAALAAGLAAHLIS